MHMQSTSVHIICIYVTCKHDNKYIGDDDMFGHMCVNVYLRCVCVCVSVFMYVPAIVAVIIRRRVHPNLFQLVYYNLSNTKNGTCAVFRGYNHSLMISTYACGHVDPHRSWMAMFHGMPRQTAHSKDRHPMTLVSNLVHISFFKLMMSSVKFSSFSCICCKVLDTSSIQLSWFFKASWMSPMSSLAPHQFALELQ